MCSPRVCYKVIMLGRFVFLTVVFTITTAGVADFDNTQVISSHYHKLRETDKDTLNVTVNIMSSFVDLIHKLEWKKVVIFHDRSRETELQVLIIRLGRYTSGYLPSVLTFETTGSSWEELDDFLGHIHQLLFPQIHIISLCDEETTSHLLTHVISTDLQPKSQSDFRHNSFWLVLAEDKWIHNVKIATTLLENVAIIPSRVIVRDKQVALTNEEYCMIVCETRDICSAYGIGQARSWQWISHKKIQLSSNDTPRDLLFPNTRYGHNGRELRVTVREMLPCLKITNNTGQPIYTGFCIDIFNDLVSTLNFSYRFVQPNIHVTGSSRSWAEMIREIQRGDADICVTAAVITTDRRKVVDYLSPNFQFKHIVILYRRGSTKILQLFRFLEPFSWEVYLAMFAALVFVSLTYVVTEIYINAGTVHCASDVFFYFCASILQQGGRIRPTTWTGRALTSTFWLFSICLAASYSAYLTASFTVTINALPFKDLRGLLQRNDYKIGIKNLGAVFTTLKNSQFGINKDVYERLFRDSQTDPSVMDGNGTKQIEKILNEKYAVIMDEDFAKYAVAADCRLGYMYGLFWTHISFVIRKGSPYKHDLDRVMSRIVDSDSMRHYRRRFLQEEFNQTMKCEDIMSGTSVSIGYMVGILSCLVIGFVASAVVLCIEIVYKKIKQVHRVLLSSPTN